MSTQVRNLDTNKDYPMDNMTNADTHMKSHEVKEVLKANKHLLTRVPTTLTSSTLAQILQDKPFTHATTIQNTNRSHTIKVVEIIVQGEKRLKHFLNVPLVV